MLFTKKFESCSHTASKWWDELSQGFAACIEKFRRSFMKPVSRHASLRVSDITDDIWSLTGSERGLIIGLLLNCGILLHPNYHMKRFYPKLEKLFYQKEKLSPSTVEKYYFLKKPSLCIHEHNQCPIISKHCNSFNINTSCTVGFIQTLTDTLTRVLTLIELCLHHPRQWQLRCWPAGGVVCIWSIEKRTFFWTNWMKNVKFSQGFIWPSLPEAVTVLKGQLQLSCRYKDRQ